ncbi:MAG: response regulator [Desulfobacterales bacterium]|nr:response regulator [Desulfobacterales bacterium]
MLSSVQGKGLDCFGCPSREPGGEQTLLKVLWVDDEISHLQPHVRFLEKRVRTVHTAESGRDALEILKSRRVDLVLLDQMMVGMDGLETLREIRRSYRELPIVMVTQSEEEELMDRALTGSVADFLAKPVNPSQILLVVKKLLTTGKLRLQQAAMEVMHEAETLRLSRIVHYRTGHIFTPAGSRRT